MHQHAPGKIEFNRRLQRAFSLKTGFTDPTNVAGIVPLADETRQNGLFQISATEVSIIFGDGKLFAQMLGDN